MNIIFSAFLLALLFAGTPLQAQVVSPRLLSTLTAAATDEKIPVIVTLTSRADLQPFVAKHRARTRMSVEERRRHRAGIIRALKSKASLSQRRLRKILKTRGVRRIKSLWIINGIALKASPETIQMLATMPEVASIRPDAVIPMPKVVPAATDGIEDNLSRIKAPDLWAMGLEGQGRVVALLDTGVNYLHPDLAADLVNKRGWRGGNNSWFNPIAADCTLPGAICSACDANADTPCDFSDSQHIAHGTAVAGVMVGGNAGGSAIGVAPAAEWIAAKIFKSDETAALSAIHQALAWVLDPDGDPATDDAPDVVNNSWGIPASTNRCLPEFQPDIQALKAAGIAVVFSAGNEGPATPSDVSPGNYAESFAVGSVGTALSTTNISSFSSRGPSACDGSLFPEVVAPGFPIRSAGLSAQYQNGLAGTSFAAPHVAGVMALLLQAFPGFPLLDLEDALKFSATDLGNPGPDNDYGYGLLNARGAYDWLAQAPNIAISDPVPPANDRLLPFGTLPLNTPLQQTLTCRNSGRGELTLGTITLSGAPPFTLRVDDCSQQMLSGGQSCNLVVEFSASVEGTFSGSTAIPSNDFDEPLVNITLRGTASASALPAPSLNLTDSVPPTGDHNLPYGLLLVGASKTESLQISNSGTGSLILGPLDGSLLGPAFFMTADGCSNQSLAGGESCAVDITFTPGHFGTFTSSLNLTSNDATTPSLRLTLSGAGNSLPSTPTLVSPADGASIASSSVSFSWFQPPDADGDKITNELLVSTNPTFTALVATQLTPRSGQQKALLAGAGSGLILCGLLLGLKRPRFTMVVSLTVGALFLLSSCGGGAGGSGATAPNQHSLSRSGLVSQTTYYWKVSANDGRGGHSESQVRTFSIR